METTLGTWLADLDSNYTPSGWEEWSWNFKAYIPLFETSVTGVLRAEPILDEDLAITLDTGDPDEEASR